MKRFYGLQYIKFFCNTNQLLAAEMKSIYIILDLAIKFCHKYNVT